MYSKYTDGHAHLMKLLALDRNSQQVVYFFIVVYENPNYSLSLR